ncbi:MAG: PilZ domain-containing protein [Acidobacteria bacterium]|nr:PilZ domain-containing protein [Acidobacteriota bacterium]
MLHQPGLQSPSAFVIAGAAHASALRRRLDHDPSITVFSESESLDALRLILEKPPKVLALDSAIVKTARGALIVSTLKEHAGVDVRVLTEDETSLPMLLVNHSLALQAASEPIEGCGTRGAKRFTMKTGVEIVVDGERSRLVNLSASGAQLVLPARVQPRQSVRLTLIGENAGKRFNGLVAWATVELERSAVKYRAGVSFVDPDANSIEAFCLRHGVTA